MDDSQCNQGSQLEVSQGIAAEPLVFDSCEGWSYQPLPTTLETPRSQICIIYTPNQFQQAAHTKAVDALHMYMYARNTMLRLQDVLCLMHTLASSCHSTLPPPAACQTTGWAQRGAPLM